MAKNIFSLLKPDKATNSAAEEAANDALPSSQEKMQEQFYRQLENHTPPAVDALNAQIVQAVNMANDTLATQAPAQVTVPKEMMLGQAGALAAQSGSAYFDSVSKLAIASKSVLLKDMTKSIAEENMKKAVEDAVGILVNDIMVSSAASIAAMTGALKPEAVQIATEQVNKSLELVNKLKSGG